MGQLKRQLRAGGWSLRRERRTTLKWGSGGSNPDRKSEHKGDKGTPERRQIASKRRLIIYKVSD